MESEFGTILWFYDKHIRCETGKNELIYQTIKSSMNQKEVLELEFLTLIRRYDNLDILTFSI